MLNGMQLEQNLRTLQERLTDLKNVLQQPTFKDEKQLDEEKLFPSPLTPGGMQPTPQETFNEEPNRAMRNVLSKMSRERRYGSPFSQFPQIKNPAHLQTEQVPIVDILEGSPNEDAWQTPNPDGYKYRNEIEVQDKRKIIVLAYGSLVNQKENQRTGNALRAGQFYKTPLEAPTDFTRISSSGTQQRRVTIVIDNQSQQGKPLWGAISEFEFLPNARNNLAAREGSGQQANKQDGYILAQIF